jgi:serine/threonine protein kinase
VDTQLLAEVRNLLTKELFTRTTDPLPGLPAAAPASASSPARQRRAGPYLLQHCIGRGGIGQVWAATRVNDVRMRVAVKFLLSDRKGDEHFERRFRAEMQMLALMRHPNIVTFLDAGRDENGEPYFAMEYVEGEPITTYCERRRLSVRQRLELFLPVCEAVQYAHRHALLHRDLKPSNILVTAEGIPKLLDFGIAKLLRPEVLGDAEPFTRPNINPMTPEYSSPEQLSGGVLTMATDVYSLGVVLFELLTSRTPFALKGKDLLHSVQLLKEHPLPRPSTVVPVAKFREYRASSSARLQKELRDEVDNIVLMALRHEPDRRYATVSEMAEDIRRHLKGLPVKAQPDSFWYRTGKFVRRRRVEVAAAAAVAISLALGLGEALHEGNLARQQRDVAQARLAQIQSLARSFESTFRSLEEMMRPGGQQRRALGKAEQEAALEPENVELQQKLARTYQTLADALGANGETSEAERLANKAVAIWEAIAQKNPGDSGTQKSLSAARELVAKVRSRVLGAVPTANASFNLSTSPEILRGYEQVGEMMRLAGDTEGAIRSYSAAANELGLDPNTPESRAHLAKLYGELAELYSSSGNTATAEQYRRLQTVRQGPEARGQRKE